MVKEIWKRITRKDAQKALILMYHQICDRTNDPWDLAVQPEKFDRQLNHLKRNYTVVSLDELVDCVRKHEISNKMVAITFDDGFEDNYLNAAPLLEAYNLPASFFISTGQLSNPRLYWWDELENIILQSPCLPVSLELELGKELFYFTFSQPSHLDSKAVRDISSWRYGMAMTSERIHLYVSLWERMRPLSSTDQYRILDSLRAWANVDHIRFESGTVMTIDQLTELSKNRLFSVGAHTVNHAMLSAQTELVQAFEVSGSQQAIERSLKRSVKSFAYPYGNYNDITKALVQHTGFDYAVCTEPNAVTSYSDLFRLPRIQIKNWDIEFFSTHLTHALNPRL